MAMNQTLESPVTFPVISTYFPAVVVLAKVAPLNRAATSAAVVTVPEYTRTSPLLKVVADDAAVRMVVLDVPVLFRKAENERMSPPAPSVKP